MSTSIRGAPLSVRSPLAAAVCAVIVALLCVACRPGAADGHTPPKLTRGVLDLRGHQLAGGEIVSLAGDWEFYWRRFLSETPETPGAREAPGAGHYFALPGFWNDRSVNGTPLQSTGFASYRLTVLRDPGPAALAVHVVDLESAYALYVDGRLIGSNGQIARDRVRERPEWRPAVHAFSVTNDRFELLLEVSNHHHSLGGVWEPMRLGSAAAVSSYREKNLALDLFLAGFILMVGIYHIFLFALRRAETAFFALGLFALIMVLRNLVTGERFLMELWPTLPWAALVRLDYLTVYAGSMVCHVYLRQVFPDYGRRHFLAMLAGSAAIMAFVLVTPVDWFSRFAGVYHVFFLYFTLYTVYVNVRAIIRGMPTARLLGAGWLVFAAANLHDILYTQAFISTRNLYAIGLQAFMLTHSYFLATRYDRAFDLMERFSERVRQLLAVTRELASAADRNAALRSARSHLAAVLGAPPTIYISDEGDAAWRMLAPDRNTEQDAESGAPGPHNPDVPDRRRRLTVARDGRTLAIVALAENGAAEKRLTREREFVDGVLDSLALVLDNLRAQRRETLAAIGQFAAEIVHDINHHCQTIFYAIKAERSGQAAGTDAETETHSLRNMALDVLDFARERLLVNARLFDVADYAGRLRPQLERLCETAGARLRFDLRSDGQIALDPDRFDRAAMNLARNALQAMPAGGEFRVMVEREDDLFYFIFEDDGGGIEATLLEKIFEPFQSGATGSGLGLAVVRRIVRAHGGDVYALSEIGQGSRFTVVLPVATPLL